MRVRFGWLCLVLLANASQAEGEWTLHGDGRSDRVKLLWLLEEWPEDLDGLTVKRRIAGSATWTRLHPEPITPEISPRRDLSDVETDAVEQARLLAWLDERIGRGLMTEATSAEMLKLFRRDPEALGLWRLALESDYDLALTTGFGLIDRRIPPLPGGTYEYGLFAVRRGVEDLVPSASYSWPYGTELELDLDLNLSIRPLRQGALAVDWRYAPEEFRRLDLAGIRIARQGLGDEMTYLIADLVPEGPESGGQGTYIDKARDLTRAATYVLIPVNYFGREGLPSSITYDPATVQEVIAAPRITRLERRGAGPEVAIGWEFDTAQERLISGFVVECTEGVAAEPRIVSATIAPATRELVDREPEFSGTWIRYAVVAQTLDGSSIRGVPAVVFLPAEGPPPAPRGFRGQPFARDGNVYIKLSWDRESDDRAVDGYVLYANSPPDPKLWRQASLGTLQGTEHDFLVYTADAATYRFQLAARGPGYGQGALTDVLEVYVGATVLPPIGLESIEQLDNRLILTWEYAPFPDLAGFRVYQDGRQVAGEETLGPEVSQWTSGPLEAGVIYELELEAVSRFGATARSFTRSIQLRH